MSIVEGIEKLRALASEQMDVVREVLRADKALEAISDQGFTQRELSEELGVDGESLTGETADSVEDQLMRDFESTSDATDPGAPAEQLEKPFIGDADLLSIVDAESLIRAGSVTEPALETPDATMSEGGVMAFFHPPPESDESVRVKGAAMVGTKKW